jgi:predicted nucleic acid-binding protein
VKYLLDTNAVIAALVPSHLHHAVFGDWAAKLQPTDFATCALTELGFIRVVMMVYGLGLSEARSALTRLHQDGVNYLETLPAPSRALPAWVRSHRQTTDGYLLSSAD